MIAQNLRNILDTVTSGTRLVAVSKYHPVESLREAYDAGQRIFGESHVQELQAKHDVLPHDIEWHFIGHLQTNKVKYIAPYVTLIHSIDSLKLLREVGKHAVKCNRTIDCLLQLHIAQEETKFGFAPDELTDMLASGEWQHIDGIRIVGLMCMASNTDDEQQVEREFELAHTIFSQVKHQYFADEPSFCELSMGMSGDYLIAMRHGSTLVRVGSSIFGNRIYQ